MALPQHIIDQAAHIARVADAIATGRLVGPPEAAARNIVSNAATLLAWVQALGEEN